MREKLITQIVQENKASAKEFLDSMDGTSTGFISESDVERLIRDREETLLKERQRIWEAILNCPDFTWETISGEPSWYMEGTIDNQNLEKLIFIHRKENQK